MLKKLFILLLGCATLTLMGCDYSFNIYRSKDKAVISIELIYYDNPDARENPSEAYLFDQDKLEVIEILDYSQIEHFMQKLSRIHSIGGIDAETLFSHDGKGIRIIYEDEYFEIITLTNINEEGRFFSAEYDNEGNQLYSIDIPGIPILIDEFNNLIEEYFQDSYLQ